jgi:hypothetical protein
MSTATLALNGFPEGAHDRVAGELAVVLHASRWARRDLWARIAAVVTEEHGLVLRMRGDLAQQLRTNGLDSLASEVQHRRVPAGCVLLYLVADVPDVCGVGVWIVDVVAAARRARTAT